jgi:hypothetical protein
MGVRAHRIKEIVYAEQALFKMGASKLGDFLENHGDTNDNRNQDGGGIMEFPFRVLKEAFEQKDKIGLEEYDIQCLKMEIADLEKEGKEDNDYVCYDLF